MERVRGGGLEVTQKAALGALEVSQEGALVAAWGTVS